MQTDFKRTYVLPCLFYEILLGCHIDIFLPTLPRFDVWLTCEIVENILTPSKKKKNYTNEINQRQNSVSSIAGLSMHTNPKIVVVS